VRSGATSRCATITCPGCSCPRGAQLTRQAVNYLLAQASARASLPSVNPHMLRHSCGFALANRAYDLRLIQDYLGHRDPKHTVRYTRTAGRRFEGLWR
jgi:site-specific recombinase XerD